MKVSTFFSVLLLVTTNISLTGQSSLDDLNIIYQHNFENNTLGKYLESEWLSDWLNPTWNSRQATTQIVRDATDNRNPSKTLQFNYPANSVSPDEGGAQWWMYLDKYDEMYISYDFMFMPGFKFQLGGKLPSAKGGKYSVENLPDGYNGFSGGLSFDDVGGIRFYVYYPDQASTYGQTIKWGVKYGADAFAPSKMKVTYATGSAVICTPGTWHNITYRMVLNTINSTGKGNYDGILEAYYDGKLVSQVSNILFRHTRDLGIDCMRMYTFFGGNSDAHRNPIAEWLRVDNVMLYNYKSTINVPRGNILSPTARTIDVWQKYAQATTPIPLKTIPSISNQTFHVAESTFSNNFIGNVLASDSDASQSLTYSITSGNDAGLFQINAQTGELKSTQTDIFDPGVSTTYNLEVTVRDNESSINSAKATITISLQGEVAIPSYAATTIYIDPDNVNDALSNGSIFHPYDSWSKIVWKKGYTYLQKKGTSTKVDKIQIGADDVTLGAYGGGQNPIISSETTTYLIYGLEKSNVHIKDLNLQAESAVSCIYFLGSNMDSIIVDHCILSGNENAIKVVDCKTLVTKYNQISSNSEGVFSSAASNEIFYNIFDACSTAVNIMGNTAKANIYNNVFYDNARSLAATYAELTLYNNVFYLSKPGQKALYHGSGKIVSDNNIYFPEQAGFISLSGQDYNKLDEIQKTMKIDINSFTSDPQFIDILAKNFKPKSTSPAINGGKNLEPGFDLAGTKVPVYSKVDIGAFEYTGDIRLQENEPSIKLYPNPSSGQFIVETQMDQYQKSQEEPLPELQELKILDMNGKLIFSKRLNMEDINALHERIDLTGRPYGLYFVLIQLGNKTITEKLILNK